METWEHTGNRVLMGESADVRVSILARTEISKTHAEAERQVYDIRMGNHHR